MPLLVPPQCIFSARVISRPLSGSHRLVSPDTQQVIVYGVNGAAVIHRVKERSLLSVFPPEDLTTPHSSPQKDHDLSLKRRWASTKTRQEDEISGMSFPVVPSNHFWTFPRNISPHPLPVASLHRDRDLLRESLALKPVPPLPPEEGAEQGSPQEVESDIPPSLPAPPACLSSSHAAAWVCNLYIQKAKRPSGHPTVQPAGKYDTH